MPPKGKWTGRTLAFRPHQALQLPFFVHAGQSDHGTRVRRVGDREVFAFRYAPEIVADMNAPFVQIMQEFNATGFLSGLATQLTRGLEQLLVTDDFFSPLPRRLGLPAASVRLPEDKDPHDGRVWSAHGSSGLIESVLTPQVWELLDERGPGAPMSLLTDGSWLLWLPHRGRRRGRDADLMAAIADRVDEHLTAGLLDPWVIDAHEHAQRWQGTAFRVIPPMRSVLFYLWGLRRFEYLGDMIRGTHAGVDFIAVSGARPAVLVPVTHRIPQHVMIARARLFADRGVSTEWHEFNRDFVITARDQRVGHAVATPRLIQYLHDADVDRVDIHGPWAVMHIRAFAPQEVMAAVETLAHVRRFLPAFTIGT